MPESDGCVLATEIAVVTIREQRPHHLRVVEVRFVCFDEALTTFYRKILGNG